MNSGKQFTHSFLTSLVVGALGAFIFWGAFAGWFSGGDGHTQLAAPAATDETP